MTNYIERFTSTVLPSDKLDEYDHVKEPFITYPLIVFSAKKNRSATGIHPYDRNKRYKLLSSSINTNSFCGQEQNNKCVRGLSVATQFHICNRYCLKEDESCRFSFPFDFRKRASANERVNSSGNKKTILLFPRSTMQIINTNPILTAMNHSNTDVTISKGNSIPEAIYVCGYAMKGESETVYDMKSARRLLSLYSDESDKTSDRQILGKIARKSVSVKVVEAQESVDFLMDNPLVYKSTKKKMVINHSYSNIKVQ